MKKLFAAAAALLIAMGASAQVGIIGGLTTTSPTVKDAVNAIKSKSVNQYHVGVAYKIPLIGGFAIQPALEYSVKGASMSDVTGISDIDFKTGFLEIPVQVQWGIDLAVARPYLFAEPFIGYAITNQASGSAFGFKDILKTWDNVRNRLEYGVGLGVGVDLFKHIQVSARYYWNLGNIYNFESVGDSFKSVVTSKCNGIAVSAAIFF